MRLLQTPFSYRFFQAAKNLEATLRIGITTVRDAGGADLGVKQAVEDGLVPGPRMHISLSMLSQTGGHGDGWMPFGGTVQCPAPEAPRRARDDRRRAGRDARRRCASWSGWVPT